MTLRLVLLCRQPSSGHHAEIRMNIAQGTRWFCSVEDAEAAGCRETRR